MSGPYREISVHLYRDALNTPWGFRLQGGKDFKAPLTIQRVFVGSPADGEIHRGDVILSIENHNTLQMIHKQAMDVIKAAGGKISLVIKRALQQRTPTSPPSAPQPNPQFYRSRPLDSTFIPTPMSKPGQTFGVDYSMRGYGAPPGYGHQGPPHGMLGRVQKTLDAAIWQPGQAYDQEGEDYEPVSVSDLKQRFIPPRNPPSHGYHGEVITLPDAEPHEESQQPEIINSPTFGHGEESEEPEYIRQSVRDLKRQFASPNARVSKPVRSRNQPAPAAGRQWKKPAYETGGSLQEPGWSPRQHSNVGWAPVKAPLVPIGQPQYYDQPHHNAGPPAHMNATPSYQQSTVPHLQEPSRPAWAGSLKTSNSSKPWEVQAAATVAGAEVGRPYQPPSHGPPSHGPPPVIQGPPPSAVQPHQPRVQNVHYGPGGGTEYEQHDPSEGGHEGATIAHLQYNTPLGLYSKANVEDALKGQTQGKPGEGTMQVL